MGSKKMFLSLLPLVVIGVLINGRGIGAVAIAVLAAAALS